AASPPDFVATKAFLVAPAKLHYGPKTAKSVALFPVHSTPQNPMKKYLALFTASAATLAAGFAVYQAAAVIDAAPVPKLSRPLPAQESAAAPFTLNTRPMVARGPKRANFEPERASRDARYVADWVVDSGDSKSMPFAIVDKTDAKVFVFDADGHLRGATAALLGLARGDDSVPGIGDRALSDIRPEERTTPAGRFVAELGRNLRRQTTLWVDYDEGFAMHALRTVNPKERRPQRLASPTPLDKRISLGCVIVPPKFFNTVVRPAFTRKGIVYILPETKSAREVFASYDVEEHARRQSTSQATSAQVVFRTAPR
ncbi:MAG: hypothetical protein Q7R45_09395, partial [Sulfuricaulis sp.]|nr:hypothetical protein [Sulfuricaulis sp.]